MVNFPLLVVDAHVVFGVKVPLDIHFVVAEPINVDEDDAGKVLHVDLNMTKFDINIVL